MSLWKSWIGVLLVGLLVSAGLLLGTACVQVYRVTHPQRPNHEAIDFESMMMRVEKIAFDAADGVKLSGWLLRGDPTRPAIILCHDLGTTRSSLVTLMVRLHRSGFTILAFDFRGHGSSTGSGSTLGLVEKRDVLGAVAFLTDRERLEHRELGIYGVGMGAHAAVLAAADRPTLRVLVLDGLYPDVGYQLTRKAFRGWSTAERYLGFVPRSIFALAHRSSIAGARAADAVPRLIGRHLLLVSPADDALLAEEMQRMYETIPEQTDADGNLVTLPATRTDALYGAELERYHSRVAAFFEQRLR